MALALRTATLAEATAPGSWAQNALLTTDANQGGVVSSDSFSRVHHLFYLADFCSGDLASQFLKSEGEATVAQPTSIEDPGQCIH